MGDLEITPKCTRKASLLLLAAGGEACSLKDTLGDISRLPWVSILLIHDLVNQNNQKEVTSYEIFIKFLRREDASEAPQS